MFALPYFIFILLLLTLSYFYRKFQEDIYWRSVIQAISFAMLTIFLGLRGFAMFDWVNYYPEFYDANSIESGENVIGVNREPGWHVFLFVCKAIWNNYHFFVLVHSVIIICLLFRFLKTYTSNPILGLALFFAFNGFGISFNLMRNSMAIFLFLNALPYLFNRQPLKYFMLCLLAVSFHYSAFLYLPLYFFLHKRLNKHVFLAIVLVMTGLYLSDLKFITEAAEMMLGKDTPMAKMVDLYSNMSHVVRFSPVFIERFVTALFIYGYWEKLHENRKETPLFINAFLWFMGSTFLLCEFSEISTRISILFVFSYWILYVDIIESFKYPNNRFVFASFVLVYCVYRTIMPMQNVVYKYDNLLTGIKSYEERLYIFNRQTFKDDGKD